MRPKQDELMARPRSPLDDLDILKGFETKSSAPEPEPDPTPDYRVVILQSKLDGQTVYYASWGYDDESGNPDPDPDSDIYVGVKGLARLLEDLAENLR